MTGSHVVFSSKDFPGTIPDHIVVSQKMVAKQPKVAQKIVNAWYDTLAYIEANPDKALKIMADEAEISTAEYEDLAGGTKLFTVDEAIAAFQPGDTVTSLEYTAGLINPFLVESGLTKKQASLKGLLRTAVHPGLRRRPSVAVTSVGAPARSTGPSRSRGRGRRQHALLRLAGRDPAQRRGSASRSFSVAALIGLWWLAADVLANVTFLPSPADTVGGLQKFWESGDLGPTSRRAACGS